MKLMLSVYAVLLALTFTTSFASATGPDPDEVAQAPAQTVEQVLAEPNAPQKVETVNAEAQPVTVVQAPAKDVTVTSEEPADTSNTDWIASVLTILGGVKGGGTWLWVLAGLQIVMGFMSTKWAKSISWLTGNAKFVASAVITLLVGPVTAITQGMDPGAAFGTGIVVTGVIKLVFEIYDRFIKKDPTAQAKIA